MENVDPPINSLEFYQKKYNYTNLDITKWRKEMWRTGICIEFTEYLEKRDAHARNKPSPKVVSYEPPSCMAWLGTTTILDESQEADDESFGKTAYLLER